MNKKDYIPDIEDGLRWLRNRADLNKLEFYANSSEACLEDDTKSSFGLLSPLGSVYKVFSLKSWFIHQDVKKVQDNAYQASIVARRYVHLMPFATPAANGQNLLYPLLSGNRELLHWHGQFQLANFVGKASCNNIKKNEFQSVQIRLALNNEWEILTDRSKLFINTEKNTKKLYEHHNRFYIALAEGNVGQMEESISEIASRKNNHKLNFDSPLESRLISVWGLMLARLAFVKGYKLFVDSAWVPSALVTSPVNNSFKSNHDFLETFDIFSPLNESSHEWAKPFGCLERFSPRRLGEDPLTFKQAASYLGITI